MFFKAFFGIFVGVLNNKDANKSVRRGSLSTVDEFPKPGCGIGWGKLALVYDLLSDNGFVADDSLTVELQCRLVETTFENRIAFALKPGDKYVKSPQFSLCNSRWSLMMFPTGLPTKKGAVPQSDHVAVYLQCEDVTLLRYKVRPRDHNV